MMRNLSDEDVSRIAQAIVKQFFSQIDMDLGKKVRKKLVYILIALLLLGGISLGIIHVPKFIVDAVEMGK